ncbi:hypothetical protein [Nocardia amikacinitolerans]|uniref:hypothetical protein n=1 Tax=Nocardia amikacinitolerans TaxID=756689 RepID=UPI0012EEB140|nr:hypothetical protein [Nocardia amikacinitolerans]
MSSPRHPAAPRRSQICWILDDDDRTRRAQRLILTIGLVAAAALALIVALVGLALSCVPIVGIGLGALGVGACMLAGRAVVGALSQRLGIRLGRSLAR